MSEVRATLCAGIFAGAAASAGLLAWLVGSGVSIRSASSTLSACVAFFTASLAVASTGAMKVPPIGAGARFQANELSSGWHRGFFNQIRTVPPCYIVMTFEPRSSPEEPLRLRHTIPVMRVQRLQVTTAPGTSMQEFDGLALAPVPDDSWQEVELDQLRSREGECEFEEATGP